MTCRVSKIASPIMTCTVSSLLLALLKPHPPNTQGFVGVSMFVKGVKSAQLAGLQDVFCRALFVGGSSCIRHGEAEEKPEVKVKDSALHQNSTVSGSFL